MKGRRITKRLIDSLNPTGREFFVWDSKLPGFGVRVQPSGIMSYVTKYRAGSGRTAPTRRVTLGRVGKITPDEAEKLAKRVLGAVAHGADPAAAKSADRRSVSLKEIAELFLTEHVAAKRKRATVEHYRHILEKLVLPYFGNRRADDLTTTDVARLHARLSKRPYLANRMVAVVGSLYGFIGRRRLLPVGFNPTRGIDKYPEKGRERYLTGVEIGRLGDAIREAETIGIEKMGTTRTVIGQHAAAAIRLLIFTGARLREILHLRWEQVDFERGLLFLPDSKTGKKAIILNAPATAVLAALPRNGAYVIAGQNAGAENEKPRADLNKPWRSVRQRAKLDGVRIHDLRHTHASIGAGAGLGLPIIGKLLGHTKSSTTQRYAHLDADPLRRASDKIGARLAAALGEPANDGRNRDDVVSLRRAKRRT